MGKTLCLAHLTHENLHIRLCLHGLKFLNEILQLLLDGQVETPGVESVNVHVVEPYEVLQVVTEPDLGRDGCCLTKMIDQLAIIQLIVVNVL